MAIHTRRDVALTVTKACPAAGANHNTATLDLKSTTAGAFADSVEVEIVIPALPSLAEGKTLTVKLQDSADDSTYADIPELAAIVVTGAASAAGSAAATRVIRLPSSAKRYLQANLAVATAGGDNTAKSVTVSLLC
ncbi:MAG TPA: hypothetical protein PLY49_12855 [Opitutaceae bacterium]|nr:hypothetical protein [Opitutaceae bacterium]